MQFITIWIQAHHLKNGGKEVYLGRLCRGTLLQTFKCVTMCACVGMHLYMSALFAFYYLFIYVFYLLIGKNHIYIYIYILYDISVNVYIV
jgi:hypothetical protein